MRAPTVAAAGLALLAATTCFFVGFELLGEAGDPLAPSSGDLLAYHYPTLKYGFEQLRAGSLPLWNPRQSCGTPFLALPNIGFFYPLYLPFLFLPADTAVTVDIGVHLTLAACGAFLLCRHLALAWAPSLLAGIVYAYSGPMLLHLNVPDHMAAVAWIPLLFLCADRALRAGSGRAAASLALALAVALLGGNPQYLYYAALGLLPLLVARALAFVRAGDWAALGRGVVAAGVGTALGLAVALVRILPSAAYMQETWRAPGSLVAAQAGLGIAPRTFAANLLDPRPEPYPAHRRLLGRVPRQAYVGTPPLLLALLGAALWRRRAVAFALTLSAAAAVLYSFGNETFFFRWMFLLPGGNWFRVSYRALPLFALSVAVLAGAGLDALGARRRRAAALLLAASAALLTGLAAAAAPAAALAPLALYAAGATALAAALALAPPASRWRGAVLALALALALFDLLRAHRFEGALPAAAGEYFARHEPVFEQIRRRQGWARTYVWASMGGADSPLRFHSDVGKAGMLHGLWLATDYEPSGTRRMHEYLSAFLDEAALSSVPESVRSLIAPIGWLPFSLDESNLALFDLLGVRFVVVTAAEQARYLERVPDWRRRFTLLFEHAGVRLFEYRHALPRAFLVDRVESVERAELLERMAAADLRSLAFVETAPDPLPPPAATPDRKADASIVGYAAGRVRIEVDSDARRLLVLTDQYDPGWKARIDGRPAEVHRADYLFRGVWVPPGRHVVELTYRPSAFILGALGSALGALAVAWLAFRPGSAGDTPPAPPGR
jgi:hypothetical protein